MMYKLRRLPLTDEVEEGNMGKAFVTRGEEVLVFWWGNL
jgi:hypothetical protein